eukprot:Clim_evm49s144 gene=Clim_evmTU49s144
MSEIYTIFGAPGSPYTLKVRAAFRYRHIPYQFVIMGGMWKNDVMAKVKVPVIPVVKTPDGEYMNDSTPLLLKMEKLYRPGFKSLAPEQSNNAVHFLIHFLEDFADEWCTKGMFHWRWFRERDGRDAARWLVADQTLGLVDQQSSEALAKDFFERQTGRNPIVGVTPANQNMIETTMFKVLDVVESLCTEAAGGPYLFGTAPTLADFALYGQISQFIVDLTIMETVREKYPYSYRWIMILDDVSGVDGSVAKTVAEIPKPTMDLVALAAEVYLPFLKANALAMQAGEKSFEFSARGMNYKQNTFKYQVRCLQDLRQRYSSLNETDQKELLSVLPSNLHTLVEETLGSRARL